MSSKKIWQYPEATSITNDDYILMDSNTETGSQCLKANKIGAVHITKTVTERKVYKASDDNANGFSEVTVAVPYTDVHYDKDDIVSFVGEDLPLKSVTAYIEPQQDLHGYDYPWPAGGGKNKLDVDKSYTFTGVKSIILDNPIPSGTTLHIKEKSHSYATEPSSGDKKIYARLVSTNDSDVGGAYVNATDGNFTLSGDATKIYLYANGYSYSESQGVTITVEELMLSKETITEWSPYSNECPISGWDEVNVRVSGVNVWDEEWRNGYYLIENGNYIAIDGRVCSKNNIPIAPNTTYYIQTPYSGVLDVIYLDADENYIGYKDDRQSRTFTTPINCHYIKFSCWGTYGGTYNNDISINYPSTDTDYHAYNGNTYTIDLDGTRYGGTLDVVSGVLTVDRAYVDIGSMTYSEYGSTSDCTQYYTTALDSLAKSNSQVISDIFVYGETVIPWTMRITAGTQGKTYFRTTKDLYESPSAFKTAMNGHQLVYELATPLTIQLTPTQVNSLMGVNNVWDDTGEIAVEWQTLYVTPTT